MTDLLIGMGLLQSAGWCLTVIALRSALRVNAALERRNAAQAQNLARYHRQDDQRSRFEEECG